MKKVTNSQPTQETSVAGNDSNVVTLGGQNGKADVPDALAEARAERAAIQALKAASFKEINSLLTEAAGIVATVGVATKEATQLADKAAGLLYQGRLAGAFNGEEVSALLGDRFGFVPKKDGTPGKTPFGEGQAIRKRVVRMVSAAEYVGDETMGGRFFEGIPQEDVADVLNGLNNGTVSIWTAYDQLTELRKANNERADMAFDPKKIATITASLSTGAAADRLANSAALRAAYAGLQDALSVASEAAGRLMQEAA